MAHETTFWPEFNEDGGADEDQAIDDFLNVLLEIDTETLESQGREAAGPRRGRFPRPAAIALGRKLPSPIPEGRPTHEGLARCSTKEPTTTTFLTEQPRLIYSRSIS